MKLRNKRTGETFNAIIREASDGNDDYELVVCDLDAYKRLKELPLKSAHTVISDRYKSLAELNEEWEDCKPKEPLIKDEKVRKAVRAWAEAQELTEVYLASNGYEIYGGVDDWVMQFKGEPFPFADKNKVYTIAELCGEEE